MRINVNAGLHIDNTQIKISLKFTHAYHRPHKALKKRLKICRLDFLYNAKKDI